MQYSLRSTMAGKTTVTVEGGSKTAYTNSKLTSGKAYYVRIRPYKVVDGKKYYGIYYKVKSVKVK